MEHKAYIFEFEEFSNELKPILEDSLLSQNVDQLRKFIQSNLSVLSDPYEGEGLPSDWEDMIEDIDAHQYGDFALTKYYSPAQINGLGYDWEGIQGTLAAQSDLELSPILGVSLGLPGQYFDPGKIGSYFQDRTQVQHSMGVLRIIESSVSGDLREALDGFQRLLAQAVNQDQGLYVTF